jgi:hypothetical protein
MSSLVLGSRAEDAFRLSMIGSGGDNEGVLVERPGWLDHDARDSVVVLTCHRQGVRQCRAAVAAGESIRVRGIRCVFE